MPMSCESTDVPAQIRQHLAQQRVQQQLFQLDEFSSPINDRDVGQCNDDGGASELPSSTADVPHGVPRRPGDISSTTYPEQFDQGRFTTSASWTPKPKHQPKPSQAPHIRAAGSRAVGRPQPPRLLRITRVPRRSFGTKGAACTPGVVYLWRGGGRLLKPRGRSHQSTQTDPVDLPRLHRFRSPPSTPPASPSFELGDYQPSLDSDLATMDDLSTEYAEFLDG